MVSPVQRKYRDHFNIVRTVDEVYTDQSFEELQKSEHERIEKIISSGALVKENIVRISKEGRQVTTIVKPDMRTISLLTQIDFLQDAIEGFCTYASSHGYKYNGVSKDDIDHRVDKHVKALKNGHFTSVNVKIDSQKGFLTIVSDSEKKTCIIKYETTEADGRIKHEMTMLQCHPDRPTSEISGFIYMMPKQDDDVALGKSTTFQLEG